MGRNKEGALFSLDFRKILVVTVAAAAIACLALPQELAAASPDKSTDIAFTAAGVFAATPVSGADLLKLSGQPFTITVIGNSSDKPTQQGRNWAVFNPLLMTGTVNSGLLPDQPIPISSTTATIEQTVGASEDIFQTAFPVTIDGIALQVKAHITLPGGTLSKALLLPFSSATLDSTNATVTYSNSTAATVLAVEGTPASPGGTIWTVPVPK